MAVMKKAEKLLRLEQRNPRGGRLPVLSVTEAASSLQPCAVTVVPYPVTLGSS